VAHQRQCFQVAVHPAAETSAHQQAQPQQPGHGGVTVEANLVAAVLPAMLCTKALAKLVNRFFVKDRLGWALCGDNTFRSHREQLVHLQSGRGN